MSYSVFSIMSLVSSPTFMAAYSEYAVNLYSFYILGSRNRFSNDNQKVMGIFLHWRERLEKNVTIRQHPQRTKFMIWLKCHLISIIFSTKCIFLYRQINAFDILLCSSMETLRNINILKGFFKFGFNIFSFSLLSPIFVFST